MVDQHGKHSQQFKGASAENLETVRQKGWWKRRGSRISGHKILLTGKIFIQFIILSEQIPEQVLTDTVLNYKN